MKYLDQIGNKRYNLKQRGTIKKSKKKMKKRSGEDRRTKPNKWKERIILTHRNRFQNFRYFRRCSLPFHKKEKGCDSNNLVIEHPRKNLVQASWRTCCNAYLHNDINSHQLHHERSTKVANSTDEQKTRIVSVNITVWAKMGHN